jgi:hypothetical protein
MNPKECVLHSGGAIGSDLVFERVGARYGVRTRAYSYRTAYHDSPSKVEISDDDYAEGSKMVSRANENLRRFGIDKWMNLLARNWAQVKYSDQVLAIGTVVKPGEKYDGYECRARTESVAGGTGYAVQMAIDEGREPWIFDQRLNIWLRWTRLETRFVEVDPPTIITNDFAGIGTRKITPAGIDEIIDLYSRTFGTL